MYKNQSGVDIFFGDIYNLVEFVQNLVTFHEGGGFGGGVDGEPDSGTLEMIPPAIKER